MQKEGWRDVRLCVVTLHAAWRTKVVQRPCKPFSCGCEVHVVSISGAPCTPAASTAVRGCSSAGRKEAGGSKWRGPSSVSLFRPTLPDLISSSSFSLLSFTFILFSPVVFAFNPSPVTSATTWSDSPLPATGDTITRRYGPTAAPSQPTCQQTTPAR